MKSEKLERAVTCAKEYRHAEESSQADDYVAEWQMSKGYQQIQS